MNNDLSVRAEHARPAGPGRDGLALQVRRLSDAVRNDDLERAKAFHASLEEHPAARGNGRLAALLQGLAEPLAQDDLAAARRALQDLRVGPSDTGSGRPAEQPGGHDRDRMRAAMREFSKAMKGDSSARSATKMSTSSSAIKPSVHPQLRLRGVRLGGACSG